MTSHNIVPSSDQGDDPFDDSGMKEFSALRLQEEELGRERCQCQATIDMLPDNVLLEIFDFYRGSPSIRIIRKFWTSWRWQTLTHVCRGWRDIVIGSPLRLELQVLCTAKTPTRISLDIWPSFPIAVFSPYFLRGIYVFGDGLAVERLAAIMQEPFPILSLFHLASFDKSVPVLLPEAFLGGSAPLLEWFELHAISFPTFPNFILSATRIVYLQLSDIPHSGYISPKEMAICLAALPNLRALNLGFQSPLSRPVQVGLPPLTSVVLPVLAIIYFKGASEYLEDLLARTHIPLLKSLDLRFFMDLIFDIPRLRRFIVQAEGLIPLGAAWVMFGLRTIVITLGPPRLTLAILCEERDWQLSSLAQVCGQHLPLSGVEQLSICELNPGESLYWKDDMDSSQWLELFHPFVAVQSLYVSMQFVPFVTSALQELKGERTMEVLPVLKNLFLEGFEPSGSVQEAIKPVISARQHSNHPIVIHSELPPPPYFRLPGDL